MAIIILSFFKGLRNYNNQHFDLLFFMISLHFGTSNYLSTHRKTSLLLINNINLVLHSLKIRRRLIQTKYTASFFTVWKETTRKPSKLATAKNIFSSVYVIVTTCFNKCFLFHAIIGRHNFYKGLLPWGSLEPPCSYTFRNKRFE